MCCLSCLFRIYRVHIILLLETINKVMICPGYTVCCISPQFYPIPLNGVPDCSVCILCLFDVCTFNTPTKVLQVSLLSCFMYGIMLSSCRHGLMSRRGLNILPLLSGSALFHVCRNPFLHYIVTCAYRIGKQCTQV
ncbi:hypothetical protein XELAEV_18013302mg [Xenopus laevis]|uniref:Uncharacterized protein n=1 Tax=Xenopus laevis TaxID=8355 RepID=A0A974HZ18_XENLA|nr:hypothetical protein XELAEV_18013302mg [Xenopus laevis]